MDKNPARRRSQSHAEVTDWLPHHEMVKTLPADMWVFTE